MIVGKDIKTEFEAAAFRRPVQHLREHPDIQNIDLMRSLQDFAEIVCPNGIKQQPKR